MPSAAARVWRLLGLLGLLGLLALLAVALNLGDDAGGVEADLAK